MRAESRAATGSTPDGKLFARAENCELRIIANKNTGTTELEETIAKVTEALNRLSLNQEEIKDQKTAETVIEEAVKALLPDGYKAVFKYEYQAPVKGTRSNRNGTDGWIKVTCTVTDTDDNNMEVVKSVTIKATPYQGSSSGGSGSGSGSGGGASSGSKAAVAGTRGNWQQDANGWRFMVEATGTYAQNTWHRINGAWYYFGNTTYAVTGWNLIGGKWYYMDMVSCAMQTGWHDDKQDGYWYFLNQDGSLALGWVKVNEKYYFLNNASEGPTYTQDAETGLWRFNGNQNLPYGAMLRNTRTPDGYWVGADGAWNGQPNA